MAEFSLQKPPSYRSRLFLWLVAGLVLLLVVWYAHRLLTAPPPAKRDQTLPVRAVQAAVRDMPVFYQGLGTVTPVNTVLVKSRVDGELMSIHFQEGQEVQAGDLLAVIDPRPFEVQRDQALGTLARDQALLRDANLDLARYRRLIKEESISMQQLQAQEALVGQYTGAVATDKANVADAELQITYCNITAPVSGRLGLKLVDQGNIIRTSDSDGIVLITQMRPMQVVFTLVEKQLPYVLEAMHNARLAEPPARLVVEAWDQGWENRLATGELLTIDNQIDTATGTIKAKAEFRNDDERLYPNQFINARLLVHTLSGVLTVPTSGIQRNTEGNFVYLVDPAGNTVHVRQVKTGHSTSDLTVINEGLQPGDTIVIDGTDRLREGVTVSFTDE